MADSSALVTLAVDDSIDTIIDKVRKAGASHVEVLVPQGTQALHSRKNCDKLRETSQRNNINLMIFSSDEKVLRSAQTCQIDNVAVDAELMMPAEPVAAAPAPRSTSTDADFLASLEDVPPAPTVVSSPRGLETMQAEPEPFVDEQDDWAAALDSFSIAAIGGEEALRAHNKETGVSDDDAWANAFNDLSDALDGDESAAAPPRKRVRAEDIMLTDDDLARQQPKGKTKGKGKGKGKRGKEKGKTTRGSSASMFAEDQDATLEQEVRARHRRRRMVIVGGITVVALLVLAGWWYISRASKVTVEVQPPAPEVGVQTYADLRINYSETPITDTTSLAVQGRVIEVPVTATIPGKVITPTEQPDKAASGVVQVYNRNPQPYTLPANTRFSTTNAAGEPVSYLSTSEVVVPAATVNLSGSTNGIADVAVAAVAGGERYNLPANTSGNWQIEGFEGALLGINAQPFTGGTNTLVKIPGEADIRALLPQAIPMFANLVPQAMQSQLQPNEGLGGGGFSPDIADLAKNPALYTLETRPIPNTDGDFELVVTANFRGLAVPNDFPQQFDRATRNALHMAGVNLETMNIVGTPTWRVADDLNAKLLLVQAQVAPKTAAGLPQSIQDEIRQSIAGLPRDQALARLKALEQQGKIGARATIPAGVAELPAAEDIVIKVAP